MKTKVDLKYLGRGVIAASLLLVVNAAGACGSDNKSDSWDDYDSGIPGTGGLLATGGAAGTGGAFLTGGTGGAGGATGGAGGTADADACIDTSGPLVDPATLDPCAIDSLPDCTDGRCIAVGVVPEESRDLLADCSDTQKCVPELFIQYNAKFLVATCQSLLGAEGRCLSMCIPQVAAQAAFLPQATCAPTERCAPCFDPRTGEDTGACHQGCDTGPVNTTPVLFPDCCGGAGSCVPADVVPEADRSLLGTDTCTGANELCAPDKLADTTYIPPVCTSIGDAEGRCLPDCIPQIAEQKDRLPQNSCPAGELCAPCFDPFTGEPTGACTRNGDMPANMTPVTFPLCCNDLGHCVPTDVLTADQQSQLAQDVCAADSLCAPDVFAAPGQMAETCRALGSFDAEGRCIPTCVPSVQEQADRLDQSTCADGYLCAPCYDPLTGADTNACTQNGDSPKETKKTFADCCGGLGLCVPTTLVPPDQQSQLGQDTCAGTDELCAPESLTDPTVKPPSCRAPGDMEARCLPACLPAIQDQAGNLRQQTCATGELCAPCFNPLDGTDTGACWLNGDEPAEDPVIFAGCCTYQSVDRGTCVPPELVSASQAAALQQDTCATGFLCAPNLKVQDQTAKFPTCTLPPFALACLLNPFGCAGACVPDCIVSPDQAGLLTQETCAAGELCAPCIDPLTGTSSGACD